MFKGYSAVAPKCLEGGGRLGRPGLGIPVILIPYAAARMVSMTGSDLERDGHG
jgi:hypothetical protein